MTDSGPSDDLRGHFVVKVQEACGGESGGNSEGEGGDFGD